jgi:hypothetical protein
MKADFFITYHHNDELAARWIAGVLKEVPFSILMDSWDFLPGQNPIEKIEHMNAVTWCMLVLISERFLQEVGDAVSWQAVMMPRPRPEMYEINQKFLQGSRGQVFQNPPPPRRRLFNFFALKNSANTVKSAWVQNNSMKLIFKAKLGISRRANW